MLLGAMHAEVLRTERRARRVHTLVHCTVPHADSTFIAGAYVHIWESHFRRCTGNVCTMVGMQLQRQLHAHTYPEGLCSLRKSSRM